MPIFPRSYVWLSIIFLPAVPSWTQSWQVQQSQTTATLRGISAVSNNVTWASGSRGTFIRTVDGGEHWQAGAVPGAEQLDFRDVEGFDDHTAILLAIGPGEKSRIYKTTDAGAHWQLLKQNTDPKAFWDCMAWWDRKTGILVGDPVDDKFQILTTSDEGQHWVAYSAPAQQGEGAFAASGSCIAVQGSSQARKARAWFGTGGSRDRVFRSTDGGASWNYADAPIASGAAAAGIFSVAFRSPTEGIAVGGIYDRPTLSEKNVVLTHDGGLTWHGITGAPPHGYRSAVANVPRSKLIVTVGTNGSDVSRDGGESWQAVDSENYNAVSFAADGSGWAVGPQGRIAKWLKK